MSLSMEDRGKIDLAVSNVAASFFPDIAYIRWSLGEDHYGEPALFFWIVIADKLPTGRWRLITFAGLPEALRDCFDFDSLGLRDYREFITVSELAKTKDSRWAKVALDAQTALP